MGNFFKSITFKIILGLFVLAAGLMVYSAVNPGNASLPEKVLTIIGAPFQKAGAGISNGFSSFWKNITGGGEAQSENAELKAEIDELNKMLIDYENCKSENERLRELLEIKEEHSEYQLVSADIIARDTDDYGTAFTIGVGENGGIKLRDTVITKSGMVGIVTEVYPTTARVTTVLSTGLQIGAKIVRTRDTGVLSGITSWALNGTMKLSYISRESTAAAGDLVVTSGASGLYPADLVIGKIESVETEENGISLYAVVNSINDINDIKNVYVITGFEGEAK